MDSYSENIVTPEPFDDEELELIEIFGATDDAVKNIIHDLRERRTENAKLKGLLARAWAFDTFPEPGDGYSAEQADLEVQVDWRKKWTVLNAEIEEALL